MVLNWMSLNMNIGKMTSKEIIKLGTQLGLSFDEKTNYPDALAKGRVVFDGANGQRFLFESKWSDKTIYEKMGEALILYGKRLKCLEINRVISIVSDFEN